MPVILEVESDGATEELVITDEGDVFSLDHEDLEEQYAAIAMGAEKPQWLRLIEKAEASPLHFMRESGLLAQLPVEIFGRLVVL